VKLSIVIPAHNEADAIVETIERIVETLEREDIDFEVLVVDDHSADETAELVDAMSARDGRVRYLRSPNPPGFGFTVRAGLDAFSGDAVAIVMADNSDEPRDLVLYYRLLHAGYDCAFGSRFMPGAVVSGYPRLKMTLNRVANLGIRLIFRHGYNDTTNAFKAYRREVIEGVRPLLSNHFNLTVELPLKAIVRGYSYAIVATSWTQRRSGVSQFHIREMGGRYLFIILYALLERYLSHGDYRRPVPTAEQAPRLKQVG
jgi:dolichol-phosphate mannosyltransferase